MEFIEEKTQKGYILKIFTKKDNFIVFDRRGASVYTEGDNPSAVHKTRIITFYGKNFMISKRMQYDYCLCKVSKNKIVIPYHYSGDPNMHFLLLDTSEVIDMVPVKILNFDDIIVLLKKIDNGYKPDLIVVDNSITSEDVVLIKNCYKDAKLLSAEEKSHKQFKTGNLQPINPRIADKLLSEVNLNMMSVNPVFLAQIHLKRAFFQKVKQLLLDFDLHPIDADYILTLIKARCTTAENKDENNKNIGILRELVHDFEFYLAVTKRNHKDVESLVAGADATILSSYMTLLAKARSMLDDENDLDYVEYENRLYERKEELEAESSEEDTGAESSNDRKDLLENPEVSIDADADVDDGDNGVIANETETETENYNSDENGVEGEDVTSADNESDDENENATVDDSEDVSQIEMEEEK